MNMKFTNLLFCLLSVFCSAFAQVPTNGLVAYYPFNGNANDESGNGNNGTVHGASLAADRFGKVNSAYAYGDLSQYVLCPDVFDYKNRSVSVWFNSTGLTNSQLIYCYDNTGLSYGFDQLELVNNNGVSLLVFKTCDGVQRLNVDISLNEWHNAITVFSNGVTTFYLDGVFVGQFQYSSYYTSGDGVNNFIIGSSRLLENGSDQHFIGLIDEVRIYNRALTEVEVQSLYNENRVNLSLGLVAYYPFNGNANDESGNGNNGTVYGASLTTDRFGKVNSAYAFDGISNYILAESTSNLNNNNYTYSFWVNSKTIKPCSFIMELGYTDLWYSQSFGVNNNYLSTSGWSANSANTNDSRINFQTGTVPTYNVWHNVVMQRSDNLVSIYEDGKLLSSEVVKGLSPYYNSPLSFYIGTRSNWATNPGNFFFGGLIDDIRIYNRALNPAEITALNSITTDSVIAGDVIADKEQIIEIPIYTNYSLSPENVISYQFDVDYDVTKLEYVGNSTVGTIAEGGSVSVNVASAGKLKVGYMNSSALVGTGNILKLQFKTIDYATTLVQLSNFYFNTKSITNIKNSVVTIADLVSPAADVIINQVSDTVNMGDTLLLTATFTEPMRNSPLPQISFSGAVTLTPTAMVMVNDTVFTYQYVVPKAQGKVLISLGTGKDLYGNTLISTPKTGNSFVIRSISYGDVDADGKIMAFDAALALQHSVNVSPVDYPLPWKAWRVETANVDGVGLVTANDAALILKYSTGIVSDFPACRSFKEKALLLNSADVIITLENNELVFRSKGKLFGLNIFYSDSSSLLGKPYILINNVMNIISIEGDKTAIGIATAYAPDENTALIRIPVLSTKSEDLQFCMNINTETTVKSLSTTTGLSDQKVDILKVYPNPVDEILNIEIPSDFKDALISIYAIDGRLVYSQKAGSANAKVNVDSLAKGVYTVIVTASDKTSATKFIKK
jgi:hypothetical protein